MIDKLTPARIAGLHRDLGKLEDLDRLIADLNEIRTTPANAQAFGAAIRAHLGRLRMHDAPDNTDLGLAALDGIIAGVALKRAEIEARTAPYVDRGAA